MSLPRFNTLTICIYAHLYGGMWVQAAFERIT